MRIYIGRDSKDSGNQAACLIAEYLRKAIDKQGYARLLLSTGASQFEMFDSLIKQDVQWNKVTMFHLDEYVDLPETHIASFRKYLKERFVSKVNLAGAWFVNGNGDIQKNISELSAKLRELPIDVGVIGIGENGHIAFNDPPADFDTDLAYKVVNLDDKCKAQQVGEKWFATVNDVPKQAITMCVKQILSSKVIISVVPHKAKADAIQKTLTQEVNPMVPATILKTHADWNLFIDSDAASDIITY